ncbi:hypothetical protein [Polyangium aurulentum]|uniref:hypothetical protein n=1 Tax=Polyangium aurulentum TaxID=2567896 RepID=UPI0010AE07AA|nr:hypothetical protein [Polyangium aurulentum]UQA61791.1 hypothetical protein E8A73_015485 [Polyangium aurulentum]
MSPSSVSLRITCEVASTVLLYRGLVSPAVRWCARRLGAGEYPARALNGAYPAEGASGRSVLQVCLLAMAMTATAVAIGLAPHGNLVWVPATALAIVLWKHLTHDYDAAHELGWQRLDRIAAAIIGAVALAYPPLALAAVITICGRLGGWTHHSMACVRIVKASFAWSLAAGTYDILVGSHAPEVSAAGLLIVLGTVYLSHYVFALKSKLCLGAKPWSWATENRTELLAASAYAWGWGRFVPEKTATKVIRWIAPVAVWLNVATLVIEGLGLVAYAHRWTLLVAIVSAAFFNSVVAVASGLLFLENIVVGAALAVVVFRLPPAVGANAFGFAPWLISLFILIAVLKRWVWRPTDLGWWDTPLTARVYWTASTRNGKSFGIYNDFMSPFDREYGRALGNALTTEPFVTFPLGGVEDSALRDRILHLDIDGEDLQDIKKQYGRCYWKPEFEKNHTAYLERLFARLNAGTDKSPLPRPLGWLKAPGGHLYYWGNLPRYRVTEGPVEAVQVRFREIYYCSRQWKWVCLRDEVLFEINTST